MGRTANTSAALARVNRTLPAITRPLTFAGAPASTVAVAVPDAAALAVGTGMSSSAGFVAPGAVVDVATGCVPIAASVGWDDAAVVVAPEATASGADADGGASVAATASDDDAGGDADASVVDAGDDGVVDADAASGGTVDVCDPRISATIPSNAAAATTMPTKSRAPFFAGDGGNESS